MTSDLAPLQKKADHGGTEAHPGLTFSRTYAPPFFFNVEATASGQHSTKYITGAIEADFLDDGVDDQSDLISTDRQEIDWESEKTRPLHEWGDQFARKVLRECTERKGKKMKDWILQNQPIAARVQKLDITVELYLKGFWLIFGARIVQLCATRATGVRVAV